MSALVGFDKPLTAEQLSGYGHNGGPPLEDRWYQSEAVDALFDYFDDPRNHGLDAEGNPKKANPLIALPTGTGKSLVIARFIQRAMMMYPDTRVFMSTHVKELIEQNAGKMLSLWPNAPLGIYSAGLKRRDHSHPIIFGGVQSSVGKFPLFGRRDLLVIDEAHLLAEEGRYLQFIEELTKGAIGADPRLGNFNPRLKIIGLTATPYRLGLGLMTNGNIFTDIAYNLCTIEGFTRLMAEGYLCPLIPKRTNTQLDVSGVKLSGGDFAQGSLQAAVDKYETTYAALCEAIQYGHDRRSWLVFASGVEHADHIGEMLNTVFGIPTVVIHSKKTEAENAANLKLWKTGKVRAAVNMNSLTTGVDHPACDMIIMLRPTMSTGLWVQMLGRGTRPYDSYSPWVSPEVAAAFPGVKLNCLVLDFANNTRNLGPINDPVVPKRKGDGPPGDAPIRLCKTCGVYNHASARECIACGTEFPSSENIDKFASELELIRSELPQIEPFPVQRSVIFPHTSKAGNESIKVCYYCGLRTFYEWVNFEGKSSTEKHKSREWFRTRYHYAKGPQPGWDGDCPTTNDEVIQLGMRGELRPPTAVNVWINTQYPRVMSYEFY